MICYTIEAALESGVFEQVIVSTDSQEIADIARQSGAKVPFMRPAELAENSVGVVEVLHHALTWLQANRQLHSLACCLVATAPFLKPLYLKQGAELIAKTDADTVMSVTRFSFPIFRAFKMNEQGEMAFLWPEYEFVHSNELPDTFHDAAQFYWGNVNRFLKRKTILGGKVVPVILPNYLVKDIDVPEDWETAELMFKTIQQRGLP